MYIDSRAVVCPLAFLSQLNHTSGGVTVCVWEEVVQAICFIDGNIQVRQVELYGWLWVSWGHADTLDSFPHHCALWLIQENGGICFLSTEKCQGYFIEGMVLTVENMIEHSETLTLNSDVKGTAGSSMLILSKAAVLSVSLWCDLYNFQHWQLISSDGAHELPIL